MCSGIRVNDAMGFLFLIEIHNLYQLKPTHVLIHEKNFMRACTRTHMHTHSYSREGYFHRNTLSLAYSNSQTCHTSFFLFNYSSTSEEGVLEPHGTGVMFRIQVTWSYLRWVLLLKGKTFPKVENNHLLPCVGRYLQSCASPHLDPCWQRCCCLVAASSGWCAFRGSCCGGWRERLQSWAWAHSESVMHHFCAHAIG